FSLHDALPISTASTVAGGRKAPPKPGPCAISTNSYPAPWKRESAGITPGTRRSSATESRRPEADFSTTAPSRMTKIVLRIDGLPAPAGSAQRLEQPVVVVGPSDRDAHAIPEQRIVERADQDPGP